MTPIAFNYKSEIANKNIIVLPKTTKKMMQMPSLQSIEQQLNQKPYQTEIRRVQYLRNLKSECLYKQNALRTAENLIDEYYRQNQQLKLQLMRLNQRVENYEERIQILRHQVETKDISSVKTYQKQLFKSSFKLSKVLEKYSELQQKYHCLEKQLAKLKSYKKQNEQKSINQQNEKQKEMKKQIQRQFNNFLRTPVNKNINNQTNASTCKKSFSKHKNVKQLHINDFESQSDSNVNTKHFHETSKDSSRLSEPMSKEFFHRSQSIKKKEDKNCNMHQKQNHTFYIDESNHIGQQELFQKLKILQYKIKEKDEQILLMLRRNKEIESKYSLLKQILQKQKSTPQQSQDQREKHKEVQRMQRNCSTHSKPTDITNNSHQLTQGNQLDQSSSSKNKKQDYNRYNTTMNDSIDNRKWKSFQTYKNH